MAYKFNRIVRASTIALAAASAWGALPATALAQNAIRTAPSVRTGVEEIIVTARRRAENSQSAPLALTALSADTLEAAGIDTVAQIFDLVPNSSFGGGIGGDLQGLVSIRGISSLVRIIGVESGLGFYVDGVFVGRPENFNQELIDVERVEVLRGPQGALYGRNTIAGAINIITTQANDESVGVAELQLGNYDLRRLRGYVSGPIAGDSVFGKLAVGYVSRGGFVEHASGGQDLDTLEMTTFRGQLRVTPNANSEFIVVADGLIDRGEPAFFETADVLFVADPTEATPFTTNQDQPNWLDRDIYGASFTANIGLGGGTLTSISAYRTSSFDAALDDDKVPFRFFVDFFSDDVKLFTQELRYSGSIGENFTYVAGAYYFNQAAESFRPFALGDFLTGVPGLELPITQTSAVDTESYAAFFSGDYDLSERLTLSIGGRITHEEKNAVYKQEDLFVGIFPNITFVGSTSDDDFSPTVSLAYDLNADAMIYGRFARGFKSAGFNTDFSASATDLTVSPESASTFEIGLRSDLLQNRVRFNAAAFTTDYKDLQVSQITGSGVILRNAAQASISGVETELSAVLSEYLSIDASLGYLDAQYDDFPACPVPGFAAPSEVKANCSGNRIVLAPEWTVALGVELTYPIASLDGEWLVRADWNHQSEIFFEPQNTNRLSGGDRSLINLRAGVRTGAWDFMVWAENLTDETYVAFADDRSAIAVPLTRAFGAPQTYGVTIRARY